MVEYLTGPFGSALYGLGAFLISFILVSVFWSMFLKIAESFFSKSKLYFLPKILKEVNRSIFLAVLLISIYIGVLFYDAILVDGAIMKIWGVLLIIVLSEIVAKVILSAIDHYYTKSRKAPTFISNALPMMKRIIGVILYGIAVLLIINYLSSEVGSIVASIGFLVLVFLFVTYYEQLKNIMAGLQLIGAHIREGDYVNVHGSNGFVEKIMDQHVIMRDIDGRTITIPNSVFVKEILKSSVFSEGNLICLDLKISGKDANKIKKRLDVVCRKTALEIEGVVKDYKPKVFASGAEGGVLKFRIKFIVMPNADLRSIVDVIVVGLSREFKDKLKYINSY